MTLDSFDTESMQSANETVSEHFPISKNFTSINELTTNLQDMEPHAGELQKETKTAIIEAIDSPTNGSFTNRLTDHPSVTTFNEKIARSQIPLRQTSEDERELKREKMHYRRQEIVHTINNRNWSSNEITRALAHLDQLFGWKFLPPGVKRMGILTTLPETFQDYAQCLAIVLITHPTVRARRANVLTEGERSGFEWAYEILKRELTPKTMGNIEKRIEQTNNSLYRAKNDHAAPGAKTTFLHHRQGKMCQDYCDHEGRGHRPTSFMKEYIMTARLNAFTEESRQVATNFDDKNRKFDIQCKKQNEVALVDMKIKHPRPEIEELNLNEKIKSLKRVAERRSFETTDFGTDFLEESGGRFPAIHTAVLQVSRGSYVQSLVDYLHLIHQGKIDQSKLTEQMKTPKITWVPTKNNSRTQLFKPLFNNR